MPRLRSLRLSNIGIYSRVDEVTVDCFAGVTCLAGANGIGKSTFISLLVYAFTGSVPSPGRSFKSLRDYKLKADKLTNEYFTGRIAQEDYDRARVMATFVCGNVTFSVERRFFRSDNISRLNVGERAFSSNKAEHFEREIVRATGVDSFEQFIFLLHFVSVFDEERHLVLWDNRALEQILFITFGERKQSLQAEALRRDMERAESRFRNLQFEAKKVEDRLSSILEISQSGETVETAVEI